jgi:hypothetical protein
MANTLSFFGGNFTMNYPEIPALNFNATLPFVGPFSLSLSRLLFSGFFYFGMSSACYQMFRFTKNASQKIFTYFRSMFNAKKYLNPFSPIAFQTFGNVQAELKSSRAYALIYGTGNRAGVTYAHYLAEKGFNLILIERDMQPLNDLENQIREKFATRLANQPPPHPHHHHA